MNIRPLYLGILCLAVFAAACSDDTKSENTKTYKVGDLYSMDGVKGIVYQLSNESGTHGLIVSLTETKTQWSTENVIVSATNEDDGAKNQAVVEAISGWQTKYPAFAWCAALNTGGVKGWYLPAYNQLKTLYTVWVADQEGFNKSLTSNGGTAIIATSPENEYYWSSTADEDLSVYAMAYMFSQNVGDYPSKEELCKVRAIRAF